MRAAAVPVDIVAETRSRLRLRLPADSLLRAAQAAIQLIGGVREVRAAPAARSLVVYYDGRALTRQAIVQAAAQPQAAARPSAPRRAPALLPVAWPMLAGALAPLLPPAGRSALALALLAGRSARAWQRGDDLPAHALDAIALATTALAGHPLTATASLLMGAVGERRRDRLLARTDRLLDALAADAGAVVRVERGGRLRRIDAAAVLAGDLLTLEAGEVLPVDALAIDGEATVLDRDPQPARFGLRLPAGTRVVSGRLRLRAERIAAESRLARLRSHVRHLLGTRDAPGALTPDLERLIALPMTAAGLVLGLTGDAERTASMLQADPQLGVAMAQPVAREAAAYATAVSGALLMGLEQLDRLATASAFAFEDVGVLAAPVWQIDRIERHDAGVREPAVRGWLAQLAGHADARLLAAGLPDDAVTRWREHGTLLRDGDRTLHIAGAAQIARTWRIVMAEPDRRSLVRRLGVVAEGRLLATVHLGCRLDVDAVRAAFAALRALGVRRIAVFTEDPSDQPAAALTQLGADAVVSRDRAAQGAWLEAAVRSGHRVALVHTGLRELLPPGGLSLCPIDAQAGAHGVLLHAPLTALLAARRSAMQVRGRLRRDMGVAVSANAALMVSAALRWLPPIGTALAKHAVALLLLERAARLADLAQAAPRGTRTDSLPDPLSLQGDAR